MDLASSPLDLHFPFRSVIDQDCEDMSHVHDKIYLTNQADFGVVRSQCENIYVLVRVNGDG